MSQGFASYSEVSLDDLLSKIEAGLAALPKQEAKIAQYLLLNVDTMSFETGKSISQKTGTAEITVGRMLRRFGCAGMKEFKSLLRQRYSISGEVLRHKGDDLSPAWRDQLALEMRALQSVYDQLDGAAFKAAERRLSDADEVYVTGFQTVRGLAEDSARRLGLARSHVRFLSAHDSMLSEWIEPARDKTSCLLLIDVVPYAAECQTLAALAKEQGRSVVVVTDEYCHWAHEVTDAVLNAPSATGLFLESILGLNAALALLIHSVANRQAAGPTPRLREWKRMSQRLKLF
ncbi:MurR/RpiR family transcriptional regulator [Methyloligella sp. 2.7D]|uniref:MurR/RpiR family transcriptional regulator n=1 Tax=unclassified Methyloligella TaxID=2625955 RepID=UPI00157D407C|nr:MurR/RpiR family transcriptional regulator [Methyloligella sp. GL2]QKP77953.1 MurR/RpiR family transcriptional regulator [Methyloligella sp. GL2]